MKVPASATPALTASALRDELRRHVADCSVCDPGAGIYCPREQEVAAAFTAMRAEEVHAERLRRAVEG